MTGEDKQLPGASGVTVASPIPEGWRDHAPLIASAAVFALIALRVLGVSNYDVTTATEIVQAGGAANVALASALASVPSIGMLCWFYVVSRVAWNGVKGALRGPSGMATVYLALFAVWTTQWLILALGLVMLAANYLPPRNHVILSRAWLLGIAAVQVWSMSSVVWLPPERIEPPDGAPYVGFVVSTTDDVAVVLRRGSGGIERVPLPELGQRSLCERQTSRWVVSVPKLISHSPYRSCPDD